MEENKERTELAIKALSELNELQEMSKTEETIKDNAIEFTIKDVKYRMRLLNSDEKTELEKQTRLKYTELIKDPSYLFRDQWVKVYKEKDIDIVKMDEEILRIKDVWTKLHLQLATVTDEKVIEELKNKIKELKNKMFSLSVEKTNLLQYSIEEQINIFITSYTAYMGLEKNQEDKWVRVFDKHEDFLKSEDNELLNNTYSKLNHMIYGI